MTSLLPVTVLIGLVFGAHPAAAQPTDSGYSAASLYNLANSYARAGKPGLAVLNYERARLLAPNDPDIQANLRLVRSSSRVPMESRPWFARAALVAGPTGISWIGTIGLTLVGASVLAGRLYPRRRWMRGVAALIGTAMIALTACNALFMWSQLHTAVVIAAATPARVSPVPMGDPLFVLPEAETVTMTGEHEGFVLIETPAGQLGWVARANIAPVLAGRP
jgi:hypothetical protein